MNVAHSMSRNGYTRSVYSAVTHLLLGFRDDEALRRNPLVARHFVAGADVALAARSVRSIVREAIDRIVSLAPARSTAIARRQREILLRYDLAGVSRDVVCNDLGITERQLYRDRRAASALLARQLLAALPGEVTAKAPAYSVDPAEVALRAALVMHATGATRVSQERLDAVARNAADVQWRVVALCLSALRHAWREEYAETSQLLNAAVQAFEANRRAIAPARAVGLNAAFDIGRGLIAWGNGASKSAARHVRAGIEQFLLCSSATPYAGDPAAHMLLQSVMSAAGMMTEAGDIGAAEILLGDTRRALDRFSEIPNYLELELSREEGRFQTRFSPDRDLVANTLAQTMHRAQHLGFPEIAANAAMLGALIAVRRRDPQRAKELQATALALSEVHDSVFARSIVQAGVVQIERRVGTPERALALAESASAGFLPGTVGQAFSTYSLAHAQLACGCPEEALSNAKAVVNARAMCNATDGRAAALLVMAESEALLGHPLEARQHLSHALELLGRYGHAYLVADARALSRRLAAMSPTAMAYQIDDSLTA